MVKFRESDSTRPKCKQSFTLDKKSIVVQKITDLQKYQKCSKIGLDSATWWLILDWSIRLLLEKIVAPICFLEFSHFEPYLQSSPN